jgi:large subunit ribosomal protein L32e
MTLEKSLELRRKIKAKKPDFIRQDAYRFAKLKNLKHWRRPVGRHSKIRAKKKGQATLVRWGFGSPKEVRGLMRSGHEPVHVFNASDVTKLDTKKQVAIVGGSVGARKRLAIVAAAEKKGVGIWNIEVTSYHADIKKGMDERKKARKSLLTRREKKEEKPQKQKKEEAKKEKAAEQAGAKADEEKKQERLEAEKVIIQK